MKKNIYFSITLSIISKCLFGQIYIDQTKDFLITEFKECYIAINNDSLLGMDCDGSKIVFSFFDNSKTCNGSMQDIDDTETNLKTAMRQLFDMGYKQNKNDGSFYNDETKIKVWFSSGKNSTDKGIMFCRKMQ